MVGSFHKANKYSSRQPADLYKQTKSRQQQDDQANRKKIGFRQDD